MYISYVVITEFVFFYIRTKKYKHIKISGFGFAFMGYQLSLFLTGLHDIVLNAGFSVKANGSSSISTCTLSY